MRKKIITISILTVIFIANIFGQEIYQSFTSAGFKVKCGCKLYVNSVFIQMAKQQGTTNVIAAYLCAENEEKPDIAVINNINIYDESSSYKSKKPSDSILFEKLYLEQYAINLKQSGMKYSYITYLGVAALEYIFDQNGIPTKALFFVKNKKSYLIQVASRKDLASKYNSLKNSFMIL